MLLIARGTALNSKLYVRMDDAQASFNLNGNTITKQATFQACVDLQNNGSAISLQASAVAASVLLIQDALFGFLGGTPRRLSS